MVLAIITAASLLATDQITGWQFLEAVIASVAAYSTGVALEDAGAKMGAKNVLDKIPVQPLNLTIGMAEPKQDTSGIAGPPTTNLTGSKTNLSGSGITSDELQG